MTLDPSCEEDVTNKPTPCEDAEAEAEEDCAASHSHPVGMNKCISSSFWQMCCFYLFHLLFSYVLIFKICQSKHMTIMTFFKLTLKIKFVNSTKILF